MIKFAFLGVFIVLIIGFVGGYLYSNQSKNDSEAPTSKEINPEILINHSNVESCWTILGGVVYDATNIIKKYPALEDKVAQICGKDSTTLLTIQKFVSNTLDNETISKINDEIKRNVVGVLAP
jgi:cytochrome b involved in lipid metabolism